MANHLKISELISLELSGKNIAMGRYDEILWKIRSGYLLVLSGTLGFFVSKGTSIKLTPEILSIILWFSLVAWIIDINFRRRQLRVVKAYNELISSSIKNLPENEKPGNINGELFHISGENLKRAAKEINGIPIKKCLLPSCYIYIGTSLLSLALYFVQ